MSGGVCFPTDISLIPNELYTLILLLLLLLLCFVLFCLGEKWASESASRVTSGNSAEAARQPLQGFGTSRGNEHMQVECYSAAPAECSAVRSLLNPKVKQNAAG